MQQGVWKVETFSEINHSVKREDSGSQCTILSHPEINNRKFNVLYIMQKKKSWITPPLPFINPIYKYASEKKKLKYRKWVIMR